VDAAGPRPAERRAGGPGGARGAPDEKGVVLLGGYDVIPAASVDAVPPNLRAAASFEEDDDPATSPSGVTISIAIAKATSFRSSLSAVFRMMAGPSWSSPRWPPRFRPGSRPAAALGT
jgi:hypothetical protein